MIVVIDTNVWISALVFPVKRSLPRQCIERASVEDVIASCDELEAELVRVLSGRFGWPTEFARTESDTYFEDAFLVRLHGTVKVCRDPKDDMVLECAERSGAELIVTGDKDLLVLGHFGKTRLVTAAQYLANGI